MTSTGSAPVYWRSRTRARRPPRPRRYYSFARLTSPIAATSIFSIFGEWSGNVRSTPTPKDCFLTVKVSRAPAPWRLSTIPSKTWIRARWPSITLKCTRTVSPALNCGMSSRTWARSIDSITLLIEKGPEGRRMLAKNPPPRSAHEREREREPGQQREAVEGDPARRPVRGEHLADQVLLRDEAPDARVAGRLPIVAHHQVHVLRNARVRVPRREVG